MSDDQIFADDSHLVIFPVIIICRNAEEEGFREFACDGPVIIMIDGHKCLAVFSDDDLAERFIAEHEIEDDLTFLYLHDPLKFAESIERMHEEQGFDGIAIDACENLSVWQDIPSLVSSMRRQFNQGGGDTHEDLTS